MKNCIVAQSGGPTAAINASLLGVIKAVLSSDQFDHIYGAINGIEGILNHNIMDLGSVFQQPYQQSLLKQTPSSYLGSCRFKLPDFHQSDDLYQAIFSFLKEKEIACFFYIGGNDSMDTVDKLSQYASENHINVQVIGIPKTIDNDLPGTDHTPGFGSAAKYIASTVKEIGCDSSVYDLKSVTIVEIMGRNAGWLTASSALARNESFFAPHLIYLPEVPFNINVFLKQVEQKVSLYSNIVVCVSEGIRDENQSYICESASSGLTDTFGHKCLSGTNKVLETLVRQHLGYKARGIELNVCQRCASHIASLTDLEEAENIGAQAVKFAAQGLTGKMLSFRRISEDPYQVQIEAIDIDLAANLEKTVPIEWITPDHCDVTPELIQYCKPLIQGEPVIFMKDGLAIHMIR